MRNLHEEYFIQKIIFDFFAVFLLCLFIVFNEILVLFSFTLNKYDSWGKSWLKYWSSSVVQDNLKCAYVFTRNSKDFVSTFNDNLTIFEQKWPQSEIFEVNSTKGSEVTLIW